MNRVYGCGIVALMSVFLCGPAFSAQLPNDAKGKLETQVNMLVTEHYISGVPIGLAQSLGPDAIPYLASILHDPERKAYWRNTVQFMNFIGSPTAFPILREFIMDRFEGEVDYDTYAGISAAIVTMGPLARNSPSAFQFLAKGVDPDSWNAVKWTFSYSRAEKRNIQMSRNCLNALGSSGMDQADRVLSELVRTSSQNRYWGELQDIVDGALTSNRGIIKEGFENYRKRRDASGSGKKRS